MLDQFMNSQQLNDRHLYAHFHPSWGGCSEELFYYRSRYLYVTEAFLRCLIDQRDFSMSGYQARKLSPQQRPILASILTNPATPESGSAVVLIVEKVVNGITDADDALIEKYPPQPVKEIQPNNFNHVKKKPLHQDLSPVEPLLNIAKRLQMPVAVKDHHVEMDIHKLNTLLHATNQTIRKNMLDALIILHEEGYKLHDHSHLTHSEALTIGDEGAV